MTPNQLRQLLTLARKDPAFERYIQRKRKDVQRQLERKRLNERRINAKEF